MSDMSEHETASMTEYDCNAHCAQCPGTGWFWGGSKCFNQYHRTRACPVPDEAARPGPARALRPPLALARPAPDPYKVVKEEIRAAYSRGQTLTEIGNDLNRRGVLPKRGSHFYPAIVRTVVLQVPREKRAKLAA
jgi:hypothetical protein